MVRGMDHKFRFAEFFAGGGMVSAALRPDWQCVLANDFDSMKCATYRTNWGGETLVEGDVGSLPTDMLHRPVDLYWASPPCQDFSLAGKGAGLTGSRSSAFHTWYDLVADVAKKGFAPPLIAFENVTGLARRRNGTDLVAVATFLTDLGYRLGSFLLDARDFLPQSRPRIFLIAVRDDIHIPSHLLASPDKPDPSDILPRHASGLQNFPRERLVSWKLPPRMAAKPALNTIMDTAPDTALISEDRLSDLVNLMTPEHRKRLEAQRSRPGLQIATVYKRGRPGRKGKISQRAELRDDGIAGCLRTPSGGSSRQTIIISENGTLGARLLSSREIARLMGLPDSYRMPERYNDAYKVAGDGVAVPVVRYLASSFFEPILKSNHARCAA